jgi:flagellar basal-body rod protein FlgB
MSWMDNNLLNQIEGFLHLASFREALVANNIANLDTPKYHTRDVDFEAELRKAQMEPPGSFEPQVLEVRGLLERPDGNNVDMDREGMLLAQSQLMYRLGVQLLRDHFKTLQSAINESQ